MSVLMPLEIKSLTIPHLKALKCSIEHACGQGHGSTFKQHYTVLNRLTLLNKWVRRRFHVTVTVSLQSCKFLKYHKCHFANKYSFYALFHLAIRHSLFGISLLVLFLCSDNHCCNFKLSIKVNLVWYGIIEQTKNLSSSLPVWTKKIPFSDMTIINH